MIRPMPPRSTLWDDHAGFGAITIGLHWTIAALAFGLFGLGLWMVALDYYDPLYTTLPDLHQSFGMAFLALISARILWRAINPRPPLPGRSRRMRAAARAVHLTLHLLPFAIVASGYLITTGHGRGFGFFGLFEVPAVLPRMSGMEDVAGRWHEYLAWALAAFALLHAAAAAKHHVIDRDDTLRRILTTRRSTQTEETS